MSDHGKNGNKKADKPPPPREAPRPYSRRAARRFITWFIALVVAWFVPLHTAGWPFNIFSWANRVEAGDKMQDAFLAVVAMVVLSGTDFFEIVVPKPGAVISEFGRGFGIFALVVYFVFILFGMAQFDALATVAKNHGDTTQYWLTMLGLLLLGGVGEFVIAGERI